MLSLLPLVASSPSTFLIAETKISELAIIEGNSLKTNNIPLTPDSKVLGVKLSEIYDFRKALAENEMLRKLAYCESGLDPAKVNWNDFGSPSFSLFQFKQGTWNTFCQGDIMSAKDQIECAAYMVSQGLGPVHWVNCWATIQ